MLSIASPGLPDVADRDTIYSESRHDVAQRDTIYSESRRCPTWRTAACVFVCVCHRSGSRALAAGVTWTCRTTGAPWGGRWHHTTVVDAAGALYVIGGYGGGSTTLYDDVWVSTDGGARPGSRRRGWSGVLGGY
jgi:hypothetical protein